MMVARTRGGSGWRRRRRRRGARPLRPRGRRSSGSGRVPSGSWAGTRSRPGSGSSTASPSLQRSPFDHILAAVRGGWKEPGFEKSRCDWLAVPLRQCWACRGAWKALRPPAPDSVIAKLELDRWLPLKRPPSEWGTRGKGQTSLLRSGESRWGRGGHGNVNIHTGGWLPKAAPMNN